jgi:hypothetical protein
MATKLRDAAEATKLFNFSLKGTKTALIATGIGALVVALGVIIAYWDDIKDAINGVNNILKTQNELLAVNRGRLESRLSLVRKQLELAILQGDNTDKLVKKEQKLVEESYKLLDAEINGLEIALEKNKAKIREVTLAESLLVNMYNLLGMTERADQAMKEAVNGTKEETEEIAAQEIAINKLKEARAELIKESIGEGVTVTGDLKGDTEKRDKVSTVKAPREDVVLKDTIKDQLKTAADTANQEFLNSEEVFQAEQTRLQEEYGEIRKRYAQEEADAKIETLYAVSNALTAAGDAVGKQTAVGKGLAISGALINTYLGITEVLSSESTIPEPFGTISKIANSLAIGS